MRIHRTLLSFVVVLLLLSWSPVLTVHADSRQLHINNAVYGREGHGKNVTSRLRTMIRDNRLEVKVDNDSMGGDPNEHTKKTLKVDYTYRGQRRTKVVNEHEWLRLP